VNQLEQWAKYGYLNNYDASKSYGQMVNYSDPHQNLDLRAKAYLDINCGHCHRKEGPASTSGLYLTYEEEDDLRWGIFKTPVAAGVGAGSHTFDVHPGKADASILVHRMNSTQPGVAMPEIGRVRIDEEGVALISEWINSLKEKS